ncbi:MAG: putative peptidoglycan glycosyltransferase FtsW [Bacillota bacterium]|nr:putative peptidoglycan glycosyltransferase FtsW [Bacillota bacterium]
MGSKTLRLIVEQLKKADFGLFIITVILALYGWVMVFSASYYYSISENGTAFYYLIRDGIWVFIGFFLMVFGALVDYRKYNNRKFVLFVVILCFVMLVVVLSPLGSTANDATRWIKLGPITIMPGEIAKAGTILFLAWFYGKNPRIVDKFLLGLIGPAIVPALFAILVIVQPNLSTAMTICFIALALILVAGMSWKYVGGCIGLLVAAVTALVLIKGGYWMERVTAFRHPFDYEATSGYQIVQGLQALGSGGLFGVGPGKSITKSLYLPYPHNDYILAIIGEETGFIGIMVLFALYAIFLWRVVKIAIEAKDQFGLLLASGLALMVGIQVVLNVAVVTASMPATGVNLPFISYGGNALMIFMFLSGVVMNISRHKDSDVIPMDRRSRRIKDRKTKEG